MDLAKRLKAAYFKTFLANSEVQSLSSSFEDIGSNKNRVLKLNGWKVCKRTIGERGICQKTRIYSWILI